MLQSPSRIFHRNLNAHLPVAQASAGVYISDKQGNRYLDACGGAAVSCLAIVKSSFKALPIFRSGFISTVYSGLLRRLKIKQIRERITLRDGDFIDLDNASRSSFDNVHVMAAIGMYGRPKIESTSGVGGPRGACERGFKYIAKFPGRANRMGIKIERKTMKAVVGRECGIRVPWLEVV